MKKYFFLKQILQSWILVMVFSAFIGCKVVPKPIVVKEVKPTLPEVNVEQDWQQALKTSFRNHYKIVANNHSKKMHANYPVITQDFLNMTLIKSDGEKIRFKMEKKPYFTFAHTSHPPLTVYSILHSSDFEVDNDSTLLKLSNYSRILDDAEKGIGKVEHINVKQKQRILSLLTQSNNYVQKVISNKETSREEYHDFAKSVRPLVEDNLYDGAMEQLTQFHKQLENWRIEFPDENWKELRVAMLGFHQPRDLYALKLYFQWLLNEPDIEKRVVYAEFQFPVFGKNREKAEERALELLTKVDLEKEASFFLLGEETLLQKDVMGPAAEKILEEWGESEWFLNEN